MPRANTMQYGELRIHCKEDVLFKTFSKLVQTLGIDRSEMEYDSIRSIPVQDQMYEFNKKLYYALEKRDLRRLLDTISLLDIRSIIERFSRIEQLHAFKAYYQVICFLKKCPLEKGKDTYSPAIDKFVEAERECALYNAQNIRALKRLSDSHPDYREIIPEIRHDIETLLGEITWTRILRSSRHGPGQSVEGGEGGKCTAFYKNAVLPYTVTADCYDLAVDTISSDPRWIGALDDWYRHKHSIPLGLPININSFWNEVLKVVPGNRVATVPKTSEIDRTIALEPSMNLFLQLGVDGVIRQELKHKWHYDLDSQELNQKLAQKGSRHGTFATLDLKGASETVTLGICDTYLPDDLMYYLATLRSDYGSVKLNRNAPSIRVKYSKLASMGNGFTFAVESLIFGAVVRWSFKKIRGRYPRKGETAVYGDDLIVPTDVADLCIEILQLSGFTINKEKSFTTGPFRESCGKDFFFGKDVRPIFLKRPLRTVMDLFYLHNSLFDYLAKWEWFLYRDPTDILKYVYGRIPKQFRKISGPPSETMDMYLFSEKPDYVSIDISGRLRTHRTLSVRPKTYKWKYKSFYFIKLMARLIESKPSRYERHTVVSGNIFLITRRDRVSYVLTERKTWF